MVLVLLSDGNDAMEQVNLNVNVNNHLKSSKSILLEENGIFTVTPDYGMMLLNLLL